MWVFHFNPKSINLYDMILLFFEIFRMESAYRTWVRQKREGISSIAVDELCRELQTALATAKWQVYEHDHTLNSKDFET